MATTRKIKKLYTLENPVWMEKSGLSKGVQHDRQHLGIILNAGSQLKIRQTNPDFTDSLRLRVLNDDRELEKDFKFKSDWVTISHSTTSVPFVDTSFTTVEPIVEYEYDIASKLLPVYQKYDNEADFFKLWDSQSAEFALISSEYVNILVPASDKEYTRKLGPVSNLNALIDYFDRVLTFYNELAGLNFEPNLPSDKNIRNKYFLKADAHGWGGAYYSDICSAESYSTMKSRWLDCQDKNWGNLHEIAHGYQGGFMNTEGFSVSEVWNNIYAASYQNIHLGDKIWTDGWLYDYGNSEKAFQTIRDFMAKGTPLNTWDLRSKLIFLMTLKDRGGNTAFTYFNQSYRKHCNQTDYVRDKHTLLDMLSASYSKIGKIDTTAFIQRVGGTLSEYQLELNQMFHEKVVYPICELVSAESLANAMTLLHLKSPLTLVDPSQLKVTGLTGDVIVNFKVDSFLEIFGETFILMEGQRYALKAKITSPQLHLPNVPTGVYTMVIPTGKGVKYTVDKYYAIVKQGSNQIDINFNRQTTSGLLSQTFNLLGLSDGNFGSVQIDYPKSTILVKITDETPHSYYSGEKYAQITIKSPEGNVIFDKEIQGTKAIVSSDKFSFTNGYQLELFHAEPGRLRQDGAVTTDKITTFTITASGVVNNKTGASNSLEILKKRVADVAAEIRKFPRLLASKYYKRKNDIYLALEVFPESERSELKKTYADVLPVENLTPGPEIGNVFNLRFLGLGDSEFFTAKFDFDNNTARLETKKAQPHAYFPDQTYASLKLVDANGIEKFRQDFKGDQWAKANVTTIQLCYFGGEELTIHHKEPNSRLTLTNELQGGKKVPALRNTVYSFVQNGLKVVSTSADEKADPSSA